MMIVNRPDYMGAECYFREPLLYYRVIDVDLVDVWYSQEMCEIGEYESLNDVPNDERAMLSWERAQLIEASLPIPVEITELIIHLPDAARDCVGIIQSYIKACQPWPMHPPLGETLCDAMKPMFNVDFMTLVAIGTTDAEIYSGIYWKDESYFAHRRGTCWAMMKSIEYTDEHYVGLEYGLRRFILDEKHRQLKL